MVLPLRPPPPVARPPVGPPRNVLPLGPPPAPNRAALAPAIPAPPPTAPVMQSPLPMIPPGPSPLAMAGSGMLNPQTAMADPAVFMALLMLIASEMEQEYQPIYPAWYEKGKDRLKKPKAGDVMHRATATKDLYTDLLLRWKADREWLRLAVVGVFENFDKDAEKTFQDASLVLDRQLVVGTLAEAELMPKVRAPKKRFADDAEKIEGYMLCARRDMEARHYRTFGVPLAYDESNTLTMYGHLVSRRIPIFDGTSHGEYPIQCDLLDPATCFPIWAGGRGLAEMHRIYRQSIGEIVGTWDRENNKIEKKILAKPYRMASGAERDRTPEDELEVYEFWDARWHTVVVDGEIIHEWEHKLGEVPFVYVRSPIGEPSQVTEPGLDGTVTQRRQELAAKGLSHIAYLKKTHEQKEAIFGAMMTELAKVRNPPRTFEQSYNVYMDAPAVTNAEGGIGMLRAGDEREVQTPLPQGFQLAGPVLTAVQEAQARGMMPREAFGIGGSQASGTGNEGLIESGRDKVQPWQATLELYHTMCLDMDLRHIRNWGHLMGADGERGQLSYASEDAENEDTYVTITPQMLRQATYKTDVKLTSFRLQHDMMKSQYVQMRKSMGLMLDSDALEMFGVHDPEKYLREIEIQEFKKTDAYRQGKLLEWMQQEGETPQSMNIARRFIMQAAMQGGGQPGMQGGGGPQGPTPPGMAQAMGAPTGRQGGAPPGAMGPQGPGAGQVATPIPPPSPGGEP